MFDGELLGLLEPDLDLTTLEKVSLGGVAGTTMGYVVHIEVGGLAGQLGFFDTYIVEFNRKALSVVLK